MAAEKAKKEKKPRKKKLLPTNCAMTNARIRRKNWYYRNGRYYANKAAAKQHLAQVAAEKTKAAAAAETQAS